MQITHLMNRIMKGKCDMSSKLESPFANEYIKDDIFNFGERYEDMIDHCRYTQLKQL